MPLPFAPCLLAVAQMAPLPTPPQAEVVVQGPVLTVPPLPTSVVEARREWPRMKVALERQIREVEEQLEGLRLLPKGGGIVAVLPAQVGEAEALAALVVDGRHFKLEQVVVENWNAWQNHLLGLAAQDPKAGKPIALGMVFRSLAGAAPESPEGEAGGELLLRALGEERAPRILGRVPRRVGLIDVLAVERMDYRRSGPLFQEAAALVPRALGYLQDAWKPLAAQVEQEASRWLELQRTGSRIQTPGLAALRNRAHVHLLCRFRTALWLDLVVWAHVAGEPLPPALGPTW